MRWLCRIGLHKCKRVGHGEDVYLECVRGGKQREPNPLSAGIGSGGP